jgi:hypothetical protein
MKGIVAAETLNQRIVDYSTLVALVLVLVTLFTSGRADALRSLLAGGASKAEATVEAGLDLALAIATCVLATTGLPLWVSAIKTLNPTADTGPLRGAFVVTWVLLVPLLFWQIHLCVNAIGLRRRL